jgi:glycosyltransferase involved in cell wall biosynthesis
MNLDQKQNSKKILFCITKSNWGGAQKYVFDLANFFSKKGYEVSIALGGDGDLAEKLRENNIKVILIKNLNNSLNPIKLFKTFLEIKKVIQKEKPDIVHTNSSFAGLSIGSACFLLSQKSVFTVHGWPFNEDRSFVVKFILKVCMYFVIFFHKKIIYVSKKVFTEKPKLSNKISLKDKIIYNGISTKIENKSFDKFRILDKNKIHFVTIAELNDNKNHTFALEALSKIEKIFVEKYNFEYHIIGEGILRESLEKQIENHIYREKIFLYGKIDEAKSYLPNFDIFILPSKTEAFGYVLLESAIAQMAVIATNVGGSPEIIDNNINGILVESENVLELKNAIQKLMQNSDLREKYGKLLKEKVEKNFSEKLFFEETEKVYKSLF